MLIVLPLRYGGQKTEDSPILGTPQIAIKRQFRNSNWHKIGFSAYL